MLIYEQVIFKFSISVVGKEMIAAQTKSAYKYYENSPCIVYEGSPYWPEDVDYIQQIKRK